MNKLMTSLGIALAVTAAASGLGLGSVAQADDTDSPPWVRVIQSGGEFRVRVVADQVPGGDTVVRIRPKNGETAVAEVGGFGDWTCIPDDEYPCPSVQNDSAPFVLDDMGMYDLDVVLRKGREDEKEYVEAGRNFAYALNPRFSSLESSNPVLSYERRGGKASGTLLAEHPRTHEVKPLADAPVHLVRRSAWGSHATERLTTDGAGRFAALFQYEGFEPKPNLQVTVDPQWSMAGVLPQRTLDLDVRATPAQVTVRQPAGGIVGRYGSTVPVKGAVTWTASDGTVRPLPDARVTVSTEGCEAYGCGLSRNSDTTGGFDVPHSVKRDGYARVELPSDSNNGWFTGSLSTRLSVDATHTTLFSPLKVTADQNRTITVLGQLAVQQGSAPAGAKATVDVQLSADGKTGWKTVKTFTTPFGTAFSQQLKHTPEQDGHYVRLRYAGTADIGPAAPTVRLTRKTTRIVRDNLAPEQVPAGTRITASGVLQQESITAAWLPLAGQKVRVYFKAKAPGSAWTYQGAATTAANGSFSTKVTARSDGSWQIRYLDVTAPYYVAIGREDYVEVM
ncbi:hypothetical protein ACE1OC_28240 [Streptomyces sp. DSM 116496]|uniref:hypothetical protein n=1 Tax=Streptomyces stoeckheimensis TaxID=3344656 RepID=UPI0038B4005D